MVVSVIFAVLFLTAIALYITGSVKKSIFLEKIPLAISVFLMEGISLPVLISRIPDSLHTAIISSLALICTGLYVILKNIPLIKSKILENAALLGFYFFWIVLFNSIFFIYRVHISISITYGVLFIAVVLFLILKLHIRNLKEAGKILIAAIFSGSLFFISLVTLVYEHNFYSILCFIGSAGLTAANILKLMNSKNEKNQTSLPDNLVLICSTGVLLAGTVLMLF